jgi:hypothetical protein
MALAQTDLGSESSTPEPVDFDSNVREVIRILMAVEGINSLERLGELSAITKSKMYDRMHKNSFTGPELVRLARVLHVAPAVLFEEADMLRARVRVIDRSLANPQLEAVQLGNEQLELAFPPAAGRTPLAIVRTAIDRSVIWTRRDPAVSLTG